MSHNFPENLKYYRKENKISQEELAAKLNLTHQAVSHYENGKRACTVDLLVKISEILNVSVEDLLFKNTVK